MQKIWIKICGITREQDALAAAELGADAIGVVLYPPSPRAVEVDDIAAIVQSLPEKVQVVALFVDPEASLVEQALKTGLVDLLQFHGKESAEFCGQFDVPYMKALAVKPGSDLSAQFAQYGGAKYILLDSYDPHLPGGTGKTFDWQQVEQLPAALKARLVLAGGLNPANVAEAINRVCPFGVDVSSSVEASKGIKDRSKMKSFIEGVKTRG
ncbi:MAG: phosphoribosylanthranilate isomerase [Pseudohongiellaceae bacterium]